MIRVPLNGLCKQRPSDFEIALLHLHHAERLPESGVSGAFFEALFEEDTCELDVAGAFLCDCPGLRWG